MISVSLRLGGALFLAALLGGPAAAADLVPYRARYALAIASTEGSSGVVGAGGVLLDEWNETCEGWTEQEHFYLHLDYGGVDAGSDAQEARETLDSYSNFVTWEAKDGLGYRSYMRRSSSDAPFEEVKGKARLGGPGQGGTAEFTQPQAAALSLAPGVLFPAGHTRLLIDRAEAGDKFVARDVFDGSDVENAGLISAAIGPKLAPGAVKGEEAPPASPLLQRPSWRITLAIFPPDRAAMVPDYQETIRLLDNGVTQEMLFDYGDYSVRATLEEIEALPRPRC